VKDVTYVLGHGSLLSLFGAARLEMPAMPSPVLLHVEGRLALIWIMPGRLRAPDGQPCSTTREDIRDCSGYRTVD